MTWEGQSALTDFQGERAHSIVKELRRKVKIALRKKADEHLEEFIHSLLKSMKNNSIELDIFLAYTRILVMNIVKKGVKATHDRNQLKAKAKIHFERYLRILESLDDSIDPQHILTNVFDALRVMDKNNICHLKTMKNGRTRIFKRYYCCLSVYDWKECQVYPCPVLWPFNEDSECPYHPDEDEQIKADVEVYDVNNDQKQ